MLIYRSFVLLANPNIQSEIRRRIDIAPRRVVVVLKRTLEWICLASTSDAAGLLMPSASCPESHESITLLLVLLPSPYAPGNNEQPPENDSSAHAHNHANDSRLRLLGQAT